MTRRFMIVAGLIALTLVAGVLAGRSSMDGAATTTPTESQATVPSSPNNIIVGGSALTEPHTDLSTRVTALEEALRNEVQARTRLEQTLQNLRPNTARAADSLHAKATPELEAATETSTQENTADASEPPALDRPQALAQLGLDNFKVTQLNKQVEELEMQHLVVRDKASREGWLNTPRYADAVRKLPDESDVYRKELGDTNYDAFLFRTGQTNRVSVQSVLAGSPAQKAGIEAGDLIYSYADERVFAWSDLTGATSSGEPGQSVRLEIVRNGKKANVYVPRGPLGVRMNAERSTP